jgi:hypothetical protein
VPDFDSGWKEAVEHDSRGFLAFFFLKIHDGVDWALDWESLAQELRELDPQGELGRRSVDVLLKVYKRGSGDTRYLHAEVQSQVDSDFARRMHTYNYRAQDRYIQPVISIAVLGDDNPDWRPNEYVFEEWGCRKSLTFPVVKLLDFAGRQEELERYPSPFAVLVLAHLQARATQHDAEARAAWKLRLVKRLYELGLDARDFNVWFRCLGWLLDLPADVEARFRAEVFRLEEESKVKRYTTFEQVIIREGQKEGLLKGIEPALDLKFGAEGLALLPVLRAQADVAVLEKVAASIKMATTVDDLRRLLPGTTTPPGV